MIERFNFYDVYGYLIPGVLLGAVLWIPHALVQGLYVPSDLTTALAAVAFAYIAGLLIALWAFGSYRSFTWTWAQTVYQHFYLAAQAPAAPQEGG